MATTRFETFVNYEDDYVQPLIEAALTELIPSWKLAEEALKEDTAQEPFLQISQYETIDHGQLFERPSTFMANSYIIRKALIRKEYLASVCQYWAAKNPEATLSKCLPHTVSLHLDYAEFLEDALMEGDGMELVPIMAKNAGVDPVDRSWWIVKASMADRGQGIHLFSTFDELQDIFGGWDPPDSDDEEEEEINDDDDATPHQGETGHPILPGSGYADAEANGDGMTSQLRHFVLQRYIEPLILSAKEGRKFHIRCYVLAVGALKVYVYRDMLALFSAKKYKRPRKNAGDLDMGIHLTNTCLQDGTREGSVERFWDLPDLEMRPGWKETQFESICKTTGEMFQAAKASPTDFQPLPNAFELYGVDWLVGYYPVEGPTTVTHIQPIQPWLLEVNAFPDLKQSGDDLKEIIGGLWKGIVTAAVAPFFKFDVNDGKTPEDFGMVNVLDLDMRR